MRPAKKEIFLSGAFTPASHRTVGAGSPLPRRHLTFNTVSARNTRNEQSSSNRRMTSQKAYESKCMSGLAYNQLKSFSSQKVSPRGETEMKEKQPRIELSALRSRKGKKESEDKIEILLKKTLRECREISRTEMEVSRQERILKKMQVQQLHSNKVRAPIDGESMASPPRERLPEIPASVIARGQTSYGLSDEMQSLKTASLFQEKELNVFDSRDMSPELRELEEQEREWQMRRAAKAK